MDKAQFKLVPVEPTDQMTYIGQKLRYDAVNSIGAIYRAMLEAAPQPPSASDERERAAYFLRRFKSEERMLGPNEQKAIDVALAALAPSPGIDAAEQKPVAWMADDGRVANAESRAGMHAITQASYCIPLYAAPPAAQPSADDKNFPFYELRFIMRVLSHEGSAPKEDWQTAYGMARQVFEQCSKDRKAAAEWLAEADRLVEAYAKEFAQGGATYARDIRRAALIAHLRTKP